MGKNGWGSQFCSFVGEPCPLHNWRWQSVTFVPAVIDSSVYFESGFFDHVLVGDPISRENKRFRINSVSLGHGNRLCDVGTNGIARCLFEDEVGMSV
jgi:hypothetical protein